MFDIDLSATKFVKNIAILILFLVIISVDILLIYKSWRAIIHHLHDVDPVITILAIIGASVVTFGGILVTFWIGLAIAFKGGMS